MTKADETSSHETPWMDANPELITHDLNTHAAKPVALGRRGFLQGLGVSGVVSLAACQKLPVKKALPYVTAPENIVPGVTVQYASTCRGCNASCGTLVSTREGRPIKMEGHPQHPASQGGLCATGQAEIRGLYDAGRLKNPRLQGADCNWKSLDVWVKEQLATTREHPIYLLTAIINSPTERKILTEFTNHISARWVEVNKPGEHSTSVHNAYRDFDQAPSDIHYNFANVDFVLGFESDFLGADNNVVAHTARVARRKKQHDRSFTHVQVEGSLSLTGAAADKRVVLNKQERVSLLLSVLAELCEKANTPTAAEILAKIPALPARSSTAAEIARRLWANRTHALVLSSSSESSIQLAVAALNHLLEAEGNTLYRTPARTAEWTTQHFLTDLADHRIGGVIFYDINPVEEWPEGPVLAKELTTLPFSLTLSTRPTATALASRATAANHHALECWADAEVPGYRSIQQACIRPIFTTRHPWVSIQTWQGVERTAFDLLRTHWLEQNWASSEQDWNHAVSVGGVPIADSTTPLQPSTPNTSSWSDFVLPTASVEVELDLIREVGILDGRNAFNPWLRELPEPLTRTSWDAAARVAPSLAKSLQLTDGDLVRIHAGEQGVELPIRILPGQAANTVAVPLGYGLIDGGRDNTPRNAYLLAQRRAEAFATTGIPAKITVLRKRARLPIIQPHPSTEGRPIVGQVKEPSLSPFPATHHVAESMWPKRDYQQHWQMIIDLDACTGCSACVVACQAENNLPVVGPEEMSRHRDMYWLRIDRYFSGNTENPDVLFQPMLCAQCDNAPCETVCPVAATVHSHDGLNQQTYNRCVGTRYCANNCPYKVRRFNWFDYAPTDPIERLVLNPDVVVRERGVMEKCTFCVQRIQDARIDSKTNGERSPQTACQQSCPAQAIHFADAKKPNNTVTQLQHQPRAFQALAELGIQPSITYLARVRRNESWPGTRGGHT